MAWMLLLANSLNPWPLSSTLIRTVRQPASRIQSKRRWSKVQYNVYKAAWDTSLPLSISCPTWWISHIRDPDGGAGGGEWRVGRGGPRTSLRTYSIHLLRPVNQYCPLQLFRTGATVALFVTLYDLGRTVNFFDVPSVPRSTTLDVLSSFLTSLLCREHLTEIIIMRLMMSDSKISKRSHHRSCAFCRHLGPYTASMGWEDEAGDAAFHPAPWSQANYEYAPSCV